MAADIRIHNIREQARQRAIVDRVYAAFLNELTTTFGTEAEADFRIMALACAQRLLEGLGSSLGVELSARELGLGRCGHCDALLGPREAETHVCKEEDLQRLKDSMLRGVGF